MGVQEIDDPTPSWALSRLRLLALVLAVPLVGLLIVRVSAPGGWYSTIVGGVCLVAAVWGVALIVLIGAGGAAAANSRALLVALFRPGLYLTAVSLVVLVLAHGGITIAVVLRFHRSVGLVLAVGAGALVGVTAIIGSIFTAVRKAEIHVIGVTVLPDAAPRLWNHVREIAGRMGALHPEHIVVGLDPDFFVTEANVNCLSGEHSGRTLYCSLPLMRILERQQFSSILGHELGHFKGADTRFSEKFYPIYRGTAGALAAMTTDDEIPNVSQLARLPAIAVLGYFMETFSLAERRLSRTREIAADAEGAGVSDRRTTAAALVKVHAFPPLWEGFQERMHHSLRARSLFINLSQSYVEQSARSASEALLEGISESHLEHPTDSHPPLHARLEALGISMEEVASEGLSTNVPDPAITLVDDSELVERKLSLAYQELMAQFLGIDLERIPEAPAASEKLSWSAKKRRERMKSSRKRRH
jgi:Zn-dependent protease with chaperone function